MGTQQYIMLGVCLFVSEDFKSGYAKNLFTVRPKKGDYIISKTLAGFTGGALTPLDAGMMNVVRCLAAASLLLLSVFPNFPHFINAC